MTVDIKLVCRILYYVSFIYKLYNSIQKFKHKEHYLLKLELCKDRLLKNIEKSEEFYFDSEHNRDAFLKTLQIFFIKNKVAFNYELINNKN